MSRKYLAARPAAMERPADGPLEPRSRAAPVVGSMLRHIAALRGGHPCGRGRSSAQADPVVASRAAYQEAVAAYKAHDLPAFLRSATEASRLRPTHGGALYALASAHALLADTAAALAALRRFAALGYTADLAADSDFASLRSLPGFVELRRRLERNRHADHGRAAGLHPPRARPAHRRDRLRLGHARVPGGQRSPAEDPPGGREGGHRRLRRAGGRRALGAARHAGRPDAASPLGGLGGGAADDAGTTPADSFRSGLFRFDLASGKLTGRFPVPDDAKPHALGDVIVTRAGDVYATDSRSPIIYRVRTGADSLEAFVASPLLLSAQGLALDADERTLYVADYARGILRVDLATREVTPVPAADDMLALGTDGLYLVGGALIGIQNGVTPHRVVAASPSTRPGNASSRSTVLERARPDYAEPTLGVVVGNELYYIANSQWEQFRDDGGIERAGRAASAAGAASAALTRLRGRIRLPPRHASRRLLRSGRDQPSTSTAAPRTRSSRSSSACCDLDERASETLLRMLQRREALGSTGVGRGIAIPHCRSLVVSRLRLAYGHHRTGVEYQAIDSARCSTSSSSWRRHSRSPTSIFRSSAKSRSLPRTPTSRIGWRPSHRRTTSSGCWGRRECSRCARWCPPLLLLCLLAARRSPASPPADRLTLDRFRDSLETADDTIALEPCIAPSPVEATADPAHRAPPGLAALRLAELGVDP